MPMRLAESNDTRTRPMTNCGTLREAPILRRERRRARRTNRLTEPLNRGPGAEALSALGNRYIDDVTTNGIVCRRHRLRALPHK